MHVCIYYILVHIAHIHMCSYTHILYVYIYVYVYVYAYTYIYTVKGTIPKLNVLKIYSLFQLFRWPSKRANKCVGHGTRREAGEIHGK